MGSRYHAGRLRSQPSSPRPRDPPTLREPTDPRDRICSERREERRDGASVLASLAYRIEYDPEAEDHLAALTARDEAMVLDSLPDQLAHQPTVTTRNRKPMKPNPVAPWELRIGRLRVYYDVQEEPERVVTVRAVGIKDRNRIYIGGTEIKL